MSNLAYCHFLPYRPVPSLAALEEDRGRWRSWGKDGKPVPRDQFVSARAFRGELVASGVDCDHAALHVRRLHHGG